MPNKNRLVSKNEVDPNKNVNHLLTLIYKLIKTNNNNNDNNNVSLMSISFLGIPFYNNNHEINLALIALLPYMQLRNIMLFKAV